MNATTAKTRPSPSTRLRSGGSRLNKFASAAGAACVLLLGGRALPAQEGTLLYEADFSSLPASKLKLTKDWSAQDGLRLQSKNWGWETATLAVGTNDYQLDAVVDICPNGPGKGNGAGFIFRKSAAKSAVFYFPKIWLAMPRWRNCWASRRKRSRNRRRHRPNCGNQSRLLDFAGTGSAAYARRTPRIIKPESRILFMRYPKTRKWGCAISGRWSRASSPIFMWMTNWRAFWT